MECGCIRVANLMLGRIGMMSLLMPNKIISNISPNIIHRIPKALKCCNKLAHILDSGASIVARGKQWQKTVLRSLTWVVCTLMGDGFIGRLDIAQRNMFRKL